MSTPESFLATYPPTVQQIAQKARALVLSVFPGAVEQVDLPGKLLGYGTDTTYQGTVCVIMPYKEHVNLGFARGTSLPDPTGLLQGMGRRARHVKLRRHEDVNNPALRMLLEAAVAEQG